jgi:hypothetical protein
MMLWPNHVFQDLGRGQHCGSGGPRGRQQGREQRRAAADLQAPLQAHHAPM